MTESQDAGAGTAGGVGGALGAAKVFSSLPPDHPFFSTIGRVAAEAAQLEHTLDLIIWELSGVNPALGSCITGQLLGPAARFNAIKALAACRSLPTDMLKRIETLSNKTNDVHHRRNRFVHDAGYTEGGAHAGQFKSFSAKDGKFGIHEVTQEYATQTIDKIKKRTFEAGTLRNDIQKLLQSSP